MFLMFLQYLALGLGSIFCTASGHDRLFNNHPPQRTAEIASQLFRTCLAVTFRLARLARLAGSSLDTEAAASSGFQIIATHFRCKTHEKLSPR